MYEDYLHYSFLLRLEEIIIQKVIIHKKDDDDGNKPVKIRILDVGCGNRILGRKIIMLFRDNTSAANIEIIGLDASRAMLKEAKRLCKEENVSQTQIRVILGKADNYPSEELRILGDDINGDNDEDNRKFDMIISGFFFIHAETKTQLQNFMNQISQHLKPGGTTLHIIPNPSNEDIAEKKDGYAFRAMLPLMVQDNGGEVKLEKEIELFDYFWRPSTYKDVVQQAGLIHFSFENAIIAPNSKLASSSADELPIRVAILEATKP